MHHPAMVEELARSFQSDLLKEAERIRISKGIGAGKHRFGIGPLAGSLAGRVSLLLAMFRLPGHP